MAPGNNNDAGSSAAAIVCGLGCLVTNLWTFPIPPGEAGLFGGRVLEIERGPGPGVYADFDTIQGEGAAGAFPHPQRGDR